MIDSRKRKTKNPCAKCFMRDDLCLCAEIPTLNLKTKVCLLIHAKELKRTTNTGSLAVQALINSEMKIRGLQDATIDFDLLKDESYHPLLFYPSEQAIELTPEFIQQIKKPILLFVPDGNWRQAAKVHHRHEELKNITHVKITAKNTAKNHLRKETTEYGMATLQATAYALGIIEGREAQEKLLALYELKLQRTLIGRGVVK